MRRILVSTFAVAALALSGAAATAGAASAAPQEAQAAGCKLVWNDNYTAGVKCSHGGSFYAMAKCKNGKWARGAVAASGTTSYAYCSSLYSSLRKPVDWYPVGV